VTPGEYLAIRELIEQQSCPNTARNGPVIQWIDALQHAALCRESRRINGLRFTSINKQAGWFWIQTSFQVFVARGDLSEGAFKFTVVRRFGDYSITAQNGIVY
jgi:hypothetical protein